MICSFVLVCCFRVNARIIYYIIICEHIIIPARVPPRGCRRYLLLLLLQVLQLGLLMQQLPLLLLPSLRPLLLWPLLLLLFIATANLATLLNSHQTTGTGT